MRLAVSNIAWPRDQDETVAGVLRGLGVTGIEVAPTKAFPDPLAATDAEIDAYRRSWEDRGLPIVAAQALLFGRPELTIFESAETRRNTLDYLRSIVRLCSRLGARSLVFGSPKNRQVGALPAAEAHAIAAGFFRELADAAWDANATIVLEANPPEYGADWVTTAAEAAAFVRELCHPALGLHLDTACMTLAGDPIREAFDAGFDLLHHFHVSEPNLAPPGASGRVDHAAFAAELADRGYAGRVSLEMREPTPFSLDAFAESVSWFVDRYRGATG
ncbi:MAG: sugar phosphate isomerase/epimerase [Gemmataceae bacterium]|nr:sugar phosphate isomerase/epimerase [Gemmataceae bacterium]